MLEKSEAMGLADVELLLAALVPETALVAVLDAFDEDVVWAAAVPESDCSCSRSAKSSLESAPLLLPERLLGCSSGVVDAVADDDASAQELPSVAESVDWAASV
jgi:hypothetical protein